MDLQQLESGGREDESGVTFRHLKFVQHVCTKVHWHQRRKVQAASYWSHPVLTAGLAVKAGGGLRAACIAFGHDTLEEGGIEVWELLRKGLPWSVCMAIRTLTPPPEERCLPWIERKARAIQRMRDYMDDDVSLVAAADKCATLKEMNWDIDLLGADVVWGRMGAWKKPLVLYYEQALEALKMKIPPALVTIYETELTQLRMRQPQKSLFTKEFDR